MSSILYGSHSLVKNVEDVVKEIRLIITTRTEILPLSKCKPNEIAEGIYKQLSQR